MISEFTHILINIFVGGLMGLLMWLSVELSVARLKDQITGGGNSWSDHAVQALNLLFISVLLGSPVEVRWFYLVVSFVAGAALCRLVYYLVSQGKIQVNLDWLFG